jgi:diguanylate cyclase
MQVCGKDRDLVLSWGNKSKHRNMTSILRLIIAVISGLAGLAAILFVLRPGVVESQDVWLLGVVSLQAAATLFSTITGAVVREEPPKGADELLPMASNADREVHSEVAKIISLLGSQVEANASFSAALGKAREQLPDSLKPEQVRLVISYLMIENENMRKRTSDLQGNLERSQRQIERLKSNLAAAELQGLSDPLTGLKNRRSFDITLAAEIASSRSAGKPLSLVMADIDHFKSINDRYGHPAGDDVLKWFAKILSNNMKGRDTVARYGGEEFAIIMPQTTLDNAALLAGQIKQQLEQQLWKKPGAPNTMLRVTASFGVAQLNPGEGTSGIIQRADAKLYESKTSGRNRVAA